MGPREAARFTADVFVIAVLALVYVVALTAQTLLRWVVGAAKTVRPSGGRGRGGDRDRDHGGPADRTDSSHERTNTGGR